tara:strand:- start:48832 stop:49233 length:402 start_codon:yes stop_codon:yes gene_type:complete
MTNINKLVLAGRLTRDVELRHSSGGMAIAKIGCVVNERRKKGDDWIEEPVFVEVTMFGKRAEAFERYHRKGAEFCFPDSRLAFDSWDDKTTGAKRSKLYVVANQWEFIGSKDPQEGSAPAIADVPFRETDTPF